MYLIGGLTNKKETPGKKDQITAGKSVPEELKERLRQSHDPGDGQEEENTHDHGGKKSQATGSHLLGWIQFPGKNHQKDNVVYSQYDLEHCECEQGDNVFEGEQFYHEDEPPLLSCLVGKLLEGLRAG
jgi:hypothetical protein